MHIKWLDAERFEGEDAHIHVHSLKSVSALLVPGGFGKRGTEGMITAIRMAREWGIPFFGICFGMQMAVLETARTGAGLTGADSSEFGDTAQTPGSETPGSETIVGLMTQWTQDNKKQTRSAQDDLGGSMRLGTYPCVIGEGTLAHELYGHTQISERHRHRYEVTLPLAKH